MEHSGAGCSTVDYCEWFKQPSPQAQRQSNLRALVKFGEKGPALVKKAGRELEVMDMHAYPPLGSQDALSEMGGAEQHAFNYESIYSDHYAPASMRIASLP